MAINPTPCQTHQTGYATLSATANLSGSMIPWQTACTGGSSGSAQTTSPAKAQSNGKSRQSDIIPILIYHIWGPYQPDDNTFCDTLYQVDLLVKYPSLFFLLAVWKETSPDLLHKPWNDVYNQYSLREPSRNGYLTFSKKSSRDEFVRWLIVYSRRFVSKSSNRNTILPSLPPGKFSGAFVEQTSSFDQMGENDLNDPSYMTSEGFLTLAGHGLLELLPAWAWIVANCRRPVYWKTGGWLFSSHADAAKFILFDPASTK